jgi:hypothetical protein
MTKSTRQALTIGLAAAIATAVIRPAVRQLVPAETTTVRIVEVVLVGLIVCVVTLGLDYMDRRRR